VFAKMVFGKNGCLSPTGAGLQRGAEERGLTFEACIVLTSDLANICTCSEPDFCFRLSGMSLDEASGLFGEDIEQACSSALHTVPSRISRGLPCIRHSHDGDTCKGWDGITCQDEQQGTGVQ
jgi:hypothetical protein